MQQFCDVFAGLYTLVWTLILATHHHIERLMWDYKKAESSTIRKILALANWEKLFDQKDINAQVTSLNKTILNFIKCITLDNKDG